MNTCENSSVLNITTLREADVERSLRLSTQAGWNQVTSDWKRFLEHPSSGCFGGWVGDELVATTCVVTYSSSVSWIGMVLVDENHRRQGFGSALFDRGLEYAFDEGGPAIGLDATALGTSLYRERGFEETAPIERWSGRFRRTETPHDATVVPPGEQEELLELDSATLDTDRTELVSRMLGDMGVTAVGVRGANGFDAYAVVRPGFEHPQIGPILAPDGAQLSALLNRIEDLLADPTVIVDAVPRKETTSVFDDHGLAQRRELIRMTHESTDPLLDADSVRGAIGFAWG